LRIDCAGDAILKPSRSFRHCCHPADFTATGGRDFAV